jgi:hypothetical protein
MNRVRDVTLRGNRAMKGTGTCAPGRDVSIHAILVHQLRVCGTEQEWTIRG